MHRERKRIDAYSGLVSYLKRELGITLTITSQKLNLRHYENYFIANGEILNTNMSIEEMELRVQESLDESTSGMAQFKIKEISEKEVRMFFVRDFDYDPDKPIILTLTWP